MRPNLLNDTVIETVNDYFAFIETNIRNSHEAFTKYDGESEFFYAAYYFPILTKEVFKTNVSAKVMAEGGTKTFFDSASTVILSDDFNALKDAEPFMFAFAGNISATPNEAETPLIIQEIQKELKRKWIEVVRSLDEGGQFFALYDERFQISKSYNILEQELSKPPLILEGSKDSYHADKVTSSQSHDAKGFDQSI